MPDPTISGGFKQASAATPKGIPRFHAQARRETEIAVERLFASSSNVTAFRIFVNAGKPGPRQRRVRRKNQKVTQMMMNSQKVKASVQRRMEGGMLRPVEKPKSR